MLLYLVRHGPAGDRDPERWPDDTRRPLTKSGMTDMKKVAQGLQHLAPDVDIVLSSPSLRAWQTAEILHEEGGWPKPKPAEVLRVGPPGAVLATLAQYEGQQSIAVVGHEPYLSRLLGAVLTPGASPAIEIKKGAVIAVEVEDGRTFASPRLLWALPPRVLRTLGR